MASNVELILKKKDYNPTIDSGNGIIVFDNVTSKIYVGGVSYSSDVKNAVWDNTNKTLTLTKSDATTITINMSDGTSSQQPNSLLAGLRDDIETNKASITTLNGSGSGSVNNKINTAINNLDGSVTIASKTNDIVTLNIEISETDGVISNTGSSTITLAKLASTGSSSDVSVTYNSTTTDVQTTINDIDSRITSLSSNQIQYIVPSSNATTPQGYNHYYSGNNHYTGTLQASASTMNRIYICRTTNGGDYHQIITVKSATGNTYSWLDMSTQTIDLTGYIKSVTINGQSYTTTASGTNITLNDVITTITSEQNIVGGNSDYVCVVATPGTASGGNKDVALTSKIKTQDISTSSSSVNGVALAYDTKQYVQSNLTTIKTWSNNDIVNS